MSVGIRLMRKQDVEAVVTVHIASFPGFFLTFLGPRFLRLLYRGILETEGHVAYVSVDPAGAVEGFVVGVEDQSSLYAGLLRRHAPAFVLASLGAVSRKPSIIPRLVRALVYPRLARNAACPALLMSIGVVPQAEGRGTGRQLVEYFMDEMRDRGVGTVCLLTDKENNERVNEFYRSLGFRVAKSFVTHEGRAMYEYVGATGAFARGPSPGMPVHPGNVEFRKAGIEDRDAIAHLHFRCSRVQPGAFMFRLGARFFREYYRVILAHQNTFVLCAEDGMGRAVGLVSGCYNAKTELAILRRHALRLFLACLPEIVKRPMLMRDLYVRKKSLDGTPGGLWAITEEARISFWGWSPEAEDPKCSARLLKSYLDELKGQGVRRVRFEVDRINRKAEVVHRLFGATLVERVHGRDGKERLIMEHAL